MRRACIVLVALTLSTAARADRDPAAAEAIFQDAKAALKRGKIDEACEKFRESNRLDPAVGTVYNLADCEERRGRIGTAWALFVEARNKLETNDERKGEVDGRIVALEPRLSRLVVRIGKKAPAGTHVTRDGVALGSASIGSAMVVDPGKHEIVAEAPGHEPRRVSIAVTEGKTERITVLPGAKLPDAPKQTEDQRMSLHPIGLTLLGVGFVSMGVGIGLGVAAKGDYDDAEPRCPGNVCDATGFEQRSDAITLSHVGTGVFFGGLGLALVGGILEIVELARGGIEEQPAHFRVGRISF